MVEKVSTGEVELCNAVGDLEGVGGMNSKSRLLVVKILTRSAVTM